MSMQLTDDQMEVITKLRAEVDALYAEDNAAWEQYREALRNGETTDDVLWERLLATQGEAQFKELIAHIPRVGERKVEAVQSQIQRLLGTGKQRDARKAQIYQARLDALASVNVWRESMGLPLLDRLPRGIVGDGAECTLARAMKLQFNGGREFQSVGVSGSGDGDIRWIDKETGEAGSASFTAISGSTVVSNFDGAQYPDLIEQQDLEAKWSQTSVWDGSFTRLGDEIVRRARDERDPDHDNARSFLERVRDFNLDECFDPAVARVESSPLSFDTVDAGRQEGDRREICIKSIREHAEITADLEVKYLATVHGGDEE